jgi:hypothetical protein
MYAIANCEGMPEHRAISKSAVARAVATAFDVGSGRGWSVAASRPLILLGISRKRVELAMGLDLAESVYIAFDLKLTHNIW